MLNCHSKRSFPVKKLIFLLSIFSVITHPIVVSAGTTFKETTCNIRYNNRGIVAGGVKCKAYFDSRATLSRVSFLYPRTNRWYDWAVTQAQVEKDPRWAECIRYTMVEGNQWQVCTVPSPQQLNIFPK